MVVVVVRYDSGNDGITLEYHHLLNSLENITSGGSYLAFTIYVFNDHSLFLNWVSVYVLRTLNVV